MKTAILFSCLLAGSSLCLHNSGALSSRAPEASSKKSITSATRRLVNGDLSKPVGQVSIIVDKSSYEMYVYDAQGWFATYPVVFGSSTLEDKKMEGDRLTPEGSFRINSKRVHQKWDRFLGLDYPTKESLEKFNARKKRGEVPASATPGGAIGIHGTWPNEDYQIDRFKNWTNGCISLKNADVEDLYSYVPVGTSITIRK